MTAGDYMFNNFTLSRVEPRALAEEEEPSIVMVHNPPPPPPQDQQLPNVPLSSQSPHPRIFQPQKAPEKWRVRRRSSAEIRSIEVIEVEVFLIFFQCFMNDLAFCFHIILIFLRH